MRTSMRLVQVVVVNVYNVSITMSSIHRMTDFLLAQFSGLEIR
jgi:hypothetical protein